MARRIEKINEGWELEKQGEMMAVNLPHTWNAQDGQTGPDMYFRGECIYRRQLKKPELKKGEQVYIEFRGVNSSAAVRMNGTELMCHDGGYSTFRVNVTDVLKDENILEVLVDNAPNDRVYPQRADFTFYGGIYRDVYLIVTDPSHFDLDYYGGRGLRITPEIDGENAVVHFETYSVGEVERILVSVAGAGETELTLETRDGKTYGKGSIALPGVHRWDGLNDPYLYEAMAVLYRGGRAVDAVTERFGCREFRFDPKEGFFLNGRPYPLHGVSRHQDRLGVGNALTRKMHEEDMDLILSMGANSIRLAHYQHDQYFYDLCDEKGIVAWAEIPYITVHMDTGRENTVTQMKELITQNYNHASIVCWALSNEITLQGVTEDLMENHRVLNDLVHEMDKTRVSAMANLFLLETDSPLVSLPDIRGYNLYYGWYVGDMEDNDTFFDEFHEKYPDTAIGLTEYGADSVITLQSPKPEKGDYTESYQALYHEHMLEMFSSRPYIWGTYVWNMFEFAAAGRDEAGDPGKNHKGLVTFDRKQRKDAFYIYKAWWSREKFVHLCGSRYHDRVEDTTEIKVYSNLEKIALYVDDVLFAEQEGAHVFRFWVPIHGVHRIRAVGICRDSGCEDGVCKDGSCEDRVCKDGSYEDSMEIAKVDEPNPSYFMSLDKVRNWFDEPEDIGDSKEGYLSLDSTMAEIQATEQGAALLERITGQMTGKAAGGMGEGVAIPEAMQKIVARQPLRKLLQQGGMELPPEKLQELNAALNQIPKVYQK